MPDRDLQIETSLQDGVLIIRASGTLKQGDMPAYFMENSSLFTDKAVIWDLRGCELGTFTYEDSKRNLYAMYTRVKMEGVTRIALVCSDAAQFGVSRMLATLSTVRDFPAMVRAFRDMAEADAWVRSQGGDDSPYDTF